MKIKDIPEYIDNEAAGCLAGLIVSINIPMDGFEADFSKADIPFGKDKVRYTMVACDQHEVFRTEIMLVFNDYDIPVATIVRDIEDEKVQMQNSNYYTMCFDMGTEEHLKMVEELPLLDYEV